MIDQTIQHYAYAHTQPESELLRALIQDTIQNTDCPHMLSDRLVGRFLKILVSLMGAERVLEIGMFTGYASLSMAEGLSEEGRLITCEINHQSKHIAEKYFSMSPHGKKIEIKMGKALETIKNLTETFDLVFVDADKENYFAYFEAVIPLLRIGGVMVFDNCLWSGKVLNPTDPSSISIAKTNDAILQDTRLENVILTVRDGLNVVRKIRN